MAFLGDLVVRLQANTADFTADLGKAAYQTEKAMKQMSRAASNFTRSIQLLGIAVSGYALARGFQNVVNAGDNFAKMSERVGLSVETLSKFAYAAQLSNVPLEAMEKGVSALAKSMTYAGLGLVTYQRYFTQLGVRIKDVQTGALRPVGDVMGDIADKFSQMEDGSKKTALAALLFQNAGVQMIPMLNAGREGLKGMTDEAVRLGIVWSQEDADAAQEFNNNLIRLGKQFDALAIKMVGSLLPWLIAVQKAFLEANKQAGSFHSQLKGMAEEDKSDWAKNLAANLGLAADAFNILLALAGKTLVTLKDMGDSIGAFAARVAALSHGDLSAFKAIGEARDAQYKAYEKQFNALDAALKNPTKYRDMFAKFVKDFRQNAAMEAATPGAVTEAFKVPGHSGGGVGIQNAMETKKYAGALQSLENMLGKLKGQTQEQITLYQTSVGSLNDLSEAHKAHLIQVAKLVDKYQMAVEEAKQWVAAQDELQASIDKSNDTFSALAEANSQYVQDIQFQTKLLGKSAEEQRRLTEMRKIDMDTIRALAQLPENATPEDIARIYAAAQQQRRAVKDALDAQIAAQRSWVTGAKSAFQDYVDAAKDAATQTKNFFTDVYQGLEDAITQFISTGKADWRSFADAIIADLARIEARKIVSNTLAPALNGVLGSIGSALFGGARAGGGPVYAGSSYLVGERGPELFTPKTSGQIVPSGAANGASFAFYQTVNIDSRADASAVRAEVAAGGRLVEQRILRSLTSGGAFARAAGKV